MLHANVEAPVPPDGVAVIVVEPPSHTFGLLAVTVGFGSTVKVPEPEEPVQPLLSVTVTEYVPAVLVLIVEVTAPVLQAYVIEPVPPEAFAVRIAGSELAQTSTGGIETVGFAFTVRVPEPEPVQPFVSVTVTE